MDRRRAFGWIALTATLGVGCFPDDALHTDAGGDAVNDLGRSDGGLTDVGAMDVRRFDVLDAGVIVPGSPRTCMAWLGLSTDTGPPSSKTRSTLSPYGVGPTGGVSRSASGTRSVGEARPCPVRSPWAWPGM